MMHVIPYDQTKMPVLPNDLGTKTPSCQTRCVLLYNSKNWYTEYSVVSSDQRKYPSTKRQVTFYGNNKIAGQNPRSKHHLSISLARQTCLYRTVCLLKIKHAFGTHCFPEKLIKKQSSKIDTDTDNLKCYFHGTLGLCKSIRYKKQIVRTMALRQVVFCIKQVMIYLTHLLISVFIQYKNSFYITRMTRGLRCSSHISTRCCISQRITLHSWNSG